MARYTRKVGGYRRKCAGNRYHKSRHHRMTHAGTKHNKSRHRMGGKKPGKKGSRSKTRLGHKNFMTHKGSKVYNQDHHYQHRNPKPYLGIRM